jgi:hypothetical protein
MNWAAGGLVLAAAGSLALAPTAAQAQVQCSVLNEAQLLVSVADYVSPASITPQTLRNIICSLYVNTAGAENLIQGPNILLTPNPITGTGTIGLAGTLTSEAALGLSLLGITNNGGTIENGQIGAVGQTITLAGTFAGTVSWAGLTAVGGSLAPGFFVAGNGTATLLLGVNNANNPEQVPVLSPLQLTSSGLGLSSSATITGACIVTWGSTQQVTNGVYPVCNPPWTHGGTIVSATAYTNGTSTPSFNYTVQINGVSVGGCTGVGISASTPATSTCSSPNSFGQYQSVTVTIAGLSGAPSQAAVQVNITHEIE